MSCAIVVAGIIIVAVSFCCLVRVMCKIYVLSKWRRAVSRQKSGTAACTKENPKIKLNCTRPSFKLNRRQKRQLQRLKQWQQQLLGIVHHANRQAHVHTRAYIDTHTHRQSSRSYLQTV